MPVFAIGTWKAPAGVTGEAVKTAIKTGYRNIDTANDYNNEAEIGVAIKECIDDGIVTREELFIQSKLWNSNHRPEHVRPDLDQTLEDLQLDYVDMYMIHWPQAGPSNGQQAATRVNGAIASKDPTVMFPLDEEGYYAVDLDSHYMETWETMEGLVDEGVVKSIGISNFNKTQVEEVVAGARIPVSLLQNECHVYLQQKDLIDLCNYRNIKFQAFSPLGSGDTNYASYTSPTGTIPLKDPLMNELAAKYGKNAGQLMLRWAVQRGTSVVSKSVTPERVVANFDLWDWEISAEDMALFDTVNCGWRHLLWGEVSHHPDYPFFDELPHGYVLEKCANFAPGQGG
jgi:diketogulonate reductase-like aldo/keto reductase